MARPNPEFHKILEELAKLHDTKNQDYANPEDGDPTMNLREVTRFGMPASTGIRSVFMRWQRRKLRIPLKT